MRRHQEQQDIENQRKQEEGQRAEKQLQGYLSHLQAEAEHKKAGLDLQKQQLELTKKAHTFDAQQKLAQMINRGEYDPNGRIPDQTTVGGQIQTTQTPGGLGPTYGVENLPTTQQNVQPTLSTMPSPQPEQIDIGAGVMFNPAGVKNNSEIFRQHLEQMKAAAPVEASIAANKAGAVAGATSQAELPAQKELLGIKTQAQRDIDAANNTRAQEVANTNANARLLSAQIGAAARRYAADKGGKVDEAAVSNNALLHAMGEGGPAFNNTPRDVASKLILTQYGYKDIDDRTSTKIRDLHGLDAIRDKMVEFIGRLNNNYLDSAGRLIKSKAYLTEVSNFQKELKSVAGNIAKTIGGESGRLSEGDIDRAMGILTTAGITKDQAIDRLKFFDANTRSKMMDQILGGAPENQKLLLLTHYGYDPRQFDIGVQYKGQTIHKYAEDPNNPGVWGVFNTKSGLYETPHLGGKK